MAAHGGHGHRLAADHVTVFYHTSPHDRGPSRSVSTTVDFPEATDDTLVLVRAAKWGARRICKPGYRYLFPLDCLGDRKGLVAQVEVMAVVSGADRSGWRLLPGCGTAHSGPARVGRWETPPQ